MEKVLSFFSENLNFVGIIVGFVVGWFLPVPAFRKAGEKFSDKIPSNLKKVFNERIDAFQEGLLKSDVNGNSTITSNEKIQEETDRLKMDLGLGK